MLNDLEIEGFRRFNRLRVGDLARVNLLVGPNNAGKTSVLEAVEVLSIGTVAGLVGPPVRRGEDAEDPNDGAAGVDVSHLFFGHSLRPGARFEIRGGGGRQALFACEVAEFKPGAEDVQERGEVSLALWLQTTQGTPGYPYQLAPDGTLPDHWRKTAMARTDVTVPVQSLWFDPVDTASLGALWDAVALTDDEEHVTEALRIIEPRTEGIAFLGGGVRRARSVVLKLAGQERRIPLGSAGDGLRRMLALTLNLIRAKGGVLLVDEIGVGLHHTVMPHMWRLVVETARRLGVQVFATTHSLDCVRALARLQPSGELANDVSVHRLDPGTAQSVVYDLEEIELAARHHVEVR